MLELAARLLHPHLPGPHLLGDESAGTGLLGPRLDASRCACGTTWLKGNGRTWCLHAAIVPEPCVCRVTIVLRGCESSERPGRSQPFSRHSSNAHARSYATQAE